MNESTLLLCTAPNAPQAFYRDAGHPDGQTGYRLMGELAARLVLDTAAGVLGGAPITDHDRTTAHRPLPAQWQLGKLP